MRDNHQIVLAKRILESAGYKVTRRLQEGERNSWRDYYNMFIGIIDKYAIGSPKVEEEINNLYTKYKEDPNFLQAYERWQEENEDGNEDSSPRDTKEESAKKPILYIIQDDHGNQLSSPSPSDDRLWDRVASMEARGRRGLSVVVYTESRKLRVKEDVDIEEPESTEQKYSSAATSINSSKLPTLFRLVDFKRGSINLDYGGGKFDNVAEYLKDTYGATNLVYDKYNRSSEHNREVLATIMKQGGADTVTCSNVLNVIAEESERLAVLRNCKKYLKAGGTCYITVYEGIKGREAGPTKAGYQLNRKTAEYEEEIKEVFSSVVRKGKLYICQ